MKFDYDAEYRKITYDTKEDYQFFRDISKKLEPVHKEIEMAMNNKFKNLKFYIANDGEISLYINGGHREGINLPQIYNIGDILCHQVKFLLWVNKEVEKIINEPTKYFWCTECGKVHNINNYEGQVFAGAYCKDCYNHNDNIKRLVDESRKPGFYD